MSSAMGVFTVGRACLKIAGRDAGRKGVIIEQLDDSFVLIDGNVRRKKVNVKHLEPLPQMLDIKDKASHEEVKKVFEKLGWETWEKKAKEATASRPRKQRKVKLKEEKKEKPKKEKKAKSEATEKIKKENIEEVKEEQKVETVREK